MVAINGRSWMARLIFGFVCVSTIQAKPNPNSVTPAANPRHDPPPAEAHPQLNQGRAAGVVGSSTRDGMWTAAARLPASAESGGNPNSRTKTDVTDGRRTADYFTSSRQRNNRRLHKVEDVGADLSANLNDDLTHDLGTEDESPLVQSLTAMASSLTEQSAENSSEKDVILSEDNSPSDQDTEPSDVEQELEQPSEEAGLTRTDEETHPQMQSPTSESKTLSTSNFVSTWSDDSNSPATRFSTTPKGLTTWSAVNGGGVAMVDEFDDTGFKGSVQRVPPEHTASAMLAFNQRHPPGISTVKPDSAPSLITRENPASDFSTTEIPRTTKSNSVLSVRKKPPPKAIGILKNRPKPNPMKFVRPQPENVIATEIGSDATHTTYQLKPVTAEVKTTDAPGRYTRRPGYPWPTNPNQVITTPRTHAANKKVAFQKIGGSTKRPNPYLKRTEVPKLSLTTPTTTSAPASTTVYFRNPGVPLVNAFPLTLSNMPFIDFIRSQILPRIGLSLISFMATSPLILSLLGASAVAGRRKRDLNGDDKSIVSPSWGLGGIDLSKILDGIDDDTGSTSVKKHGALYNKSSSKEEALPAKDDSQSFTTMISKLFKPSSKSSILKKSKFNDKNKYTKMT